MLEHDACALAREVGEDRHRGTDHHVGGDADTVARRVESPLLGTPHQLPAGLRRVLPAKPMRQHVHVVIRTPNGNDYGKDLLRQHYEQHKHDPSHGHAH